MRARLVFCFSTAGQEEFSDAQVELVNQQARELVEWSSLLLQSPSVEVDDVEGVPRNVEHGVGNSSLRCLAPAAAGVQLQNRCCNRTTQERVGERSDGFNGGAESIFDTLAFDYAPSFGYYMDGFAFDTELRGVMRATMFNSEIVVRWMRRLQQPESITRQPLSVLCDNDVCRCAPLNPCIFVADWLVLLLLVARNLRVQCRSFYLESGDTSPPTSVATATTVSASGWVSRI